MEASAELDLKQRLFNLTGAERRSISAYLVRLKYASEEGQEELSRLMQEMDVGQKTKLPNISGLRGHE